MLIDFCGGGVTGRSPLPPYPDSRESSRVARVLFILATARMQRAAELLRTTRLGIKQVAQEVGYTSLVTFIHKVMPSAYRQASRKGVQK